jgi:arylsulfatase A-like enzyme
MRWFIPFSLLLATLGCGGDTNTPSTTPSGASSSKPPIPTGSAPSWEGSTLDALPGSTALVLDRMPATYSFPETNMPKGVGDAGTFVVTNVQTQTRGNATWYVIDTPFYVPEAERRFAPAGVKVYANGEELQFSTVPAERASPRNKTWRLSGRRTAITFPDKVTEVRIEHPIGARTMERVNWGTAKANMSEEAFAHYGATVGAISREGLLLPAPASATWAGVTLPDGANFTSFVGRAATPLAGTSDGSEIVLSFTTGGETIELGRRKISGDIADLESWKLDLSAYGGKTGDLKLETLPRGDNAFDHVLVSAPAVVGSHRDVRRVLVVGIDTLRPDHLGTYGYPLDTSPELDAWAKDAVVFDRAWTSAPRTRPSFRAATTGRRPLDAVCEKNIGEVFDENGYATAGIVANVHLNPRFDFQKGFDYWWHAGEGLITEQVQRAKRWFKANEGRDTYMFLHIMDPHIFYRAPEPYASRFTDGLPELSPEDALPKRFNRHDVYRWMGNKKLSDARKAHIRAAYDAEVAFTSEELTDFLAWVDELPGETLVVIHNDHGEEFWEHGGYEHNHTLYDDTTRALMFVRPPGGTGDAGARSAYPATLQDIAPTVYDFAGFTDTPKTDGTSLLPAVRGDADTGWTRAIPIGHLRYDTDRWGVVWQDHKYVLHTGSGREELYDLKSDPAEKNNLAGSTDTAPYWQALGKSHSVPVGHGWRIKVDIPTGTEVTLQLPADAVLANVLDPEKIVAHPANQVWGEKPKKLPEEVASVTLSDDKRTVTLVGGSKGSGVVVVLFDQAVTPDGVAVTVEGATDTLAGGKKVTVGRASLTADAGIVIDTPPDEAARMVQCESGEDVKGSDMEMLKALGYVGEDGAEGHGH